MPPRPPRSRRRRCRRASCRTRSTAFGTSAAATIMPTVCTTRHHDVEVGVAEHVARVEDGHRLRARTCPVRNSRLEAQSRISGRFCRIMPTVSRTLDRLLVALHRLARGGEAPEVEREPDDREDDRGDRQRALQVAGACDLRRDDDGDQQDRQAGGDHACRSRAWPARPGPASSRPPASRRGC